MNKSIGKQKGFTLIELVIVIVILGILAAVSIPKFVDLISNASQSAVDGVAGSLGSAAAINHAGCSATGHVVTANKCIAVALCSDVATAVTPALVLAAAGAAVEGSFNLAADSAVVGNGTEVTCTLQYMKSGVPYTKDYVAIGTAQ